MIVDMERSDLSKICKFNSVKISKLKFVEEYKHLYHYVSEFKGKLKKNITVTKANYKIDDAWWFSFRMSQNKYNKAY